MVVLLVSHTLADGLGTFQAITDTATGTGPVMRYPPAAARPWSRAVREDARTPLRSLPDAARALAAAGRLGRARHGDLAES